jgi:hypothetical protein
VSAAVWERPRREADWPSAAFVGKVAGVSKKYAPLFEHLCRAGDAPVEMTFEEIDRLVGGLPVSATKHRAWWANEVAGGRVQAKAWLDAGRTDAGRVWFSAARWNRGA